MMEMYSIGVFDSGAGGLTVVRQLFKRLPEEHFIYFGDTARVPYGGKSSETIIRYSIENAAFLLKKNVKLLVVACSTASAYALEELEDFCTIPVVGMIESGAECAVQSTSHGRIGVLGTKATILSQAYQKAILKRDQHAIVIPVACPLLVPLIEERFLEHVAAQLILKEYLKPLKEQSVDTILLGCTHYPLLKKMISNEMGSEVVIVDPAAACAEKVVEILKLHDLNHPSRNLTPHHYFVSDDPFKFKLLAEDFLGHTLVHVELSL